MELWKQDERSNNYYNDTYYCCNNTNNYDCNIDLNGLKNKGPKPIAKRSTTCRKAGTEHFNVSISSEYNRYLCPSLRAMHNLDIVRNIPYVPLHNENIACIFVS